MERVCVSEDFEDEIYDYEAIFKKFAFGRCRRCEGPANGIVIGDHILWALCCNCGTASWAMVSFDGWGKRETRFRQELAEVAGWDVGAEDEGLVGSGWDLGEERQGAYITGTRGERTFSLMYGLPWRDNTMRQDFRAADGTRIHVRTVLSEWASFAIRPDDAEQDDIHVLMALNLSAMEAVVQGWWGGPPSQHRGRSQLKSTEDFPLQWKL